MSLTKRDPRLRAFVRVDNLGQVVGGSLVLRKRKPVTGTWVEITPNVCCTTTTTSTTSTTSTSTSSTSTSTSTTTSSTTTTTTTT